MVNIGVCILFHVTYLHCCAFGSSDCIYHLICMCDLFKFITLICRHCLNETLFACSNILKKSTSQAKVNDCTVCFQECKLHFFINIGTRIKIFKQKKKKSLNTQACINNFRTCLCIAMCQVSLWCIKKIQRITPFERSTAKIYFQ